MNTKNITAFLMAAVLIAGSAFFAGCEKEKTTIPNHPVSPKNLVDPTPSEPEGNPYDVYGYCYTDLIEYWSELLKDKDITEVEFMQQSMEFFNDAYPSINPNAFSNAEKATIQRFMDDYLSYVDQLGWLEASLVAEESLLGMGSSSTRNALLNLVSQLKHSAGLLDVDLQLLPSWDERFDNCMRNHAAEVWEDGNWVDQAIFLISAGEAVLGWAASCAWSATFDANAPICQ